MSDLKINFIGDSHSVLTFGQTILKSLDVLAPIHFLAFSGLKLQHLVHSQNQAKDLQISNFEKQPGMSGHLSKDPLSLGKSFRINSAEILIVALGTNDIVEYAVSQKSPAFLKSAIENQLKQIQVKNKIYIEPPLLAIDINSNIRQVIIETVRDFNFTVILNDRFRADQSDGIHMKKEMALDFGNYVSKELEGLLKLIFPHH